ncbi:hypothetical protein V6N11_001737 [Hibiscus sabdariffa]|uniref:Uncharacterized protein n=1 Tax=Hibiscus sabdariffa TaxID=183260 RepID=A0ABR2NRE1_9ROSI
MKKLKNSLEVYFLNVGFNFKANIKERTLWDIAGLGGVGGVLGTDSVLVEENENVEVDGVLCEMVLCDNNNISWAESIDRAMNAKNGLTEDLVIDPALESDNTDFP